MPTQPPDLSLVIVSWNTRDLLAQCLRSVYETAAGLALEVFVVDNASTDGSAEMVESQFPGVTLIRNPENAGFARANNQAIGISHGRCVLLLNSDAWPLSDALAQMVSFLDTHLQSGIVGPSLIYPDGRPQSSHGDLPRLGSEIWGLLGFDKLTAHARGENPTDDRWVETGWISGACLMARRQTLDQIGLLDERFFMFGEEIDLCRRARRAGWLVCHLPSARAVHVEAGSTGQTAERVLRLYRGKLRYFAKHHGPGAMRALLAAMRLSATLKAVTYSLARHVRRDLSARSLLWRSAARGLAQIPLEFAHPGA